MLCSIPRRRILLPTFGPTETTETASSREVIDDLFTSCGVIIVVKRGGTTSAHDGGTVTNAYSGDGLTVPRVGGN